MWTRALSLALLIIEMPPAGWDSLWGTWSQLVHMNVYGLHEPPTEPSEAPNAMLMEPFMYTNRP